MHKLTNGCCRSCLSEVRPKAVQFEHAPSVDMICAHTDMTIYYILYIIILYYIILCYVMLYYIYIYIQRFHFETVSFGVVLESAHLGGLPYFETLRQNYDCKLLAK